MKKLTKSISLILAGIMLISTLASCAGNQQIQGSTETGTQAQAPTGTSVTDGTDSGSNTVTDILTDSNIVTTPIPGTNDIQTVDPWETLDMEIQTDTNVNVEIPETDPLPETESNSATLAPESGTSAQPNTESATNAPTAAPETEAPTAAPGTDAPTTTPAEFPSNSFPLLEKKQYLIKLTIPDGATATERLVASELKKALKSKTSVDISTSTDYGKNDKSTYEIIIGQTTHAESVGVYNSASFNSYGVKVIGNKIVFFFTTDNEGSELVEQFSKSIRSNDAGQFWVADTLSLINTVSPALSSIPKFPESDSKLTTVNCGDNTQMVVVKSTSLTKFNEYCNTLKSNKYVEYSKRDNIDGNYFRIYTMGNTAINAYFSTGRGQARIIVGPLKDIPSKDKDTTPETIKPSVTMIGPSESTGNGLGLVYQLANGKFLIIDGGHILSDRIYKELRELQPNSNKFIIAGWFVSHPHNDHQDAIENFITEHGHEVEIENIYFNYANAAYYNNLSSEYHQGADQKEGARVTRLRELLAKKLSLSTRIVKPHTGQIYTFGSAQVEIISTVEDFLPTKLTHVNDSSMVIRVTIEGQSCMVLADAADGMKGIILKMYNSSLKSDMVTMAHHGVWDTTPELYNKIKGKVLFWPSNTASAKEFYGKSDTSEAKKAIVAALNNATDVFLAKGTDTKLMLPYTPVGNKSKFMQDTLS